MAHTHVSNGMTLSTLKVQNVHFLSKNYLKTFIFREIKDLYDKATFQLGKDFTIEACHNDMEHGTNGINGDIKPKFGGIESMFGGNHPGCKSLTVEDSQPLVFKGENQFVTVDVKEIKTIHNGICYGKFKILKQVWYLFMIPSFQQL